MLTLLEEELYEALRDAAKQDGAAVISAYTVTLAASFAPNSKGRPADGPAHRVHGT